MNIGIILSGGTGNRFNSDIPKQYHMLNEKYVVEYSLLAMEKSQSIDEIIVAVSEEYLDFPVFSKYNCHVIKGGDTRNKSIRNALDYIYNKFDRCQNIIINDAARPLITEDIINKYISKLEEYDAVNTTQKITDSIGHVNKWYINREDYFLIQAPEAFKFKIIYDSFKAYSPITATYHQLPENSLIYNNFEFKNNLKITYPVDLIIAKHILKEKQKL